MKKAAFFSLCLVLALALSCKKEGTNGPSSNLLSGAEQYEGVYPAPAPVTFTEHDSAVSVESYPGQVVVFFHPETTETAAKAVITGNGGEVLSKIPSVGYYLAEVSSSDAAGFIQTLQSEAAINFACPNVVVSLSQGAFVLDGCNSGVPAGESHSQTVIRNLEDCGGVFGSCDNIIDANGTALADYILHGLIRAIQQNGNGPILVNISAAAGLNDGSWPSKSPAEQKRIEASWYYFMRNLLTMIEGLDQTYRDRLVVTVASGNGDMPIDRMMGELRVNPAFEKILDENVLLVSNKSEAMQPNGGNYAPNDPDVVVLDNPDAPLGTSYASPCALGILQEIIDSLDISTSEALKALKLASMANAGRFVNPSEIVDVLTIIYDRTEYKGNGTTLAFDLITGPCVGKITFINKPSIYWNGTEGTLIMPSDCTVTLISGDGCFIVGNPHDVKTFQFNLSGTNAGFSGTGSTSFAIGQGAVPVSAAFTGAVNIMGDVSGTLSLTLLGEQSATITLFKQ